MTSLPIFWGVSPIPFSSPKGRGGPAQDAAPTFVNPGIAAPAMTIMLTVAFTLTIMIAVKLTLCPRSRRERDYSYGRDQNIASSIVLPGLTHYEAPE